MKKRKTKRNTRTISAEVLNFLAGYFGVDVEQLAGSRRLDELSLIMPDSARSSHAVGFLPYEIEDRFTLTISDEQFKSLTSEKTTVEKVVKYVQASLPNKRRARKSAGINNHSSKES
jgi:acyl carrier protein